MQPNWRFLLRRTGKSLQLGLAAPTPLTVIRPTICLRFPNKNGRLLILPIEGIKDCGIWLSPCFCGVLFEMTFERLCRGAAVPDVISDQPQCHYRTEIAR